MARRIIFLVGHEFELLDLSGPLCAFNCAKEFHEANYKISVSSIAGGLVMTSSGVSISTEKWAWIRPDDTVIVCGGREVYVDNQLGEIAKLLKRLSPTNQRITSVCTGSFYLAEAGLLDGCRATTHWRWASALQARYRKVLVEADCIYTKDGNIWTSAGITAGIDMALALIEEDYGRELSRSVSRDLLVYYRRLGGQSQFSTILELEPSSDRVRDSLLYAREHLHEHLPVERLAEVARISPRQFSRVFLKETGETPARAIERLRAEIALPRIEEGREPIENIARDTGFGDVETMRRCFVRRYGQSPQSLRRLARAHAERLG